MPAKSIRKPKQTTAAAADPVNGTEPAHGAPLAAGTEPPNDTGPARGTEPIDQDAPGGQSAEDQSAEDRSAEPEVPLNRAERRARKKGNPKTETSGAFPVGGRQAVRRGNPVHTQRQWATRRSG